MPRRRTGGERHQRPAGTATKQILLRFSEEDAALIKRAGTLDEPTYGKWATETLVKAAKQRLARREGTK